MVTDHDAVAVVIVIVPAAMPATVMAVESDARAVVAIAIVVTVAADAHAEFGGAGDRRHADCDRRESSKYVRKLLHVLLQCRCTYGENKRPRLRFPEQRRNFLE